MNVTVVKLFYDGADSPRGKCYFAAWDDDDPAGFGFVGWGPGTVPTQFQRRTSKSAQAKAREKENKGYEESRRFVATVDGRSILDEPLAWGAETYEYLEALR